MSRGGVLVGLAVLFSTVSGAPHPLLGQMEAREVTSLRFQGNQQFSDEALASAIITRDTECRSFLFTPFCLAGAGFSLEPHFLNERELRRDHARVRLFYYLRGYRDTEVDTLVARPGSDEARITFTVQEGRPIQVTEVEFTGAEELPDTSALEDLPIQVGEPLSLIALDATRDTVEARLRNQGFAHADVLRNYFIPRETPYEAQVSFQVYPGPLTRLGPITVDLTSTDGEEPSVD